MNTQRPYLLISKPQKYLVLQVPANFPSWVYVLKKSKLQDIICNSFSCSTFKLGLNRENVRSPKTSWLLVATISWYGRFIFVHFAVSLWDRLSKSKVQLNIPLKQIRSHDSIEKAIYFYFFGSEVNGGQVGSGNLKMIKTLGGNNLQ